MLVASSPSWDRTPLSHTASNMFFELARQASLPQSLFQQAALPRTMPHGRHYDSIGPMDQMEDRRTLLEELRLRRPKLLVPLDDDALFALTGKDSIAKWHLSIIDTELTDGSKIKTVPLLHPEYIFRSYTDLPFLIRGMGRLKEELTNPQPPVSRTLHIQPRFAEAMEYLRHCYHSEFLSLDIETRRGQITCCAYAPSPIDGMSIPLLPEHWNQDELHKLWSATGHVLAGPSGKVFQNYIYDTSYFSRYGLVVNNLWMDTMLAQKFLYPELAADLGTLARIWIREPYWKDEGRKWRPEDGIESYYRYNVKDAAATLEIAHAMARELANRGKTEIFQQLVQQLAGPSSEMCWHGLPVSEAERQRLLGEYTEKSTTLTTDVNVVAEPLLGKPLNPRSPAQVKAYLSARRYRIPVKKGKETSDVTALLKLQIRHPGDPVLPLLIQLSEVNKAISSYLKIEPESDGRIRFSQNLHGAMTGRWSCSKTPWDRGFNAQTLPSEFKSMVVAPDGWEFLELDLKQADARFVAWDAAAPTLMKFLSEGQDIHRFVAAMPELFNKPMDQITKMERQLGKKTGHAANYGMRGATHSEACLREMGLVLSVDRADQMLEGYHRFEPAIRVWHARLREEMKRTKRLTTPLGREWHIFGRLEDDTFRQGYAYRPQSTVVDVINRLIMHTHRHRNPEHHIHINQVHDSYIMLSRQTYRDEILAILRAQSDWNPRLSLAGGELQIPIELKVGPTLATMEELPV